MQNTWHSQINWNIVQIVLKQAFCRSSHTQTWQNSQKFGNVTGKHLCRSLFLIKLQGMRPATLLKRDSSTSAFLSNFRNYSENLFLQNTSGGCFCFWNTYHHLPEGPPPVCTSSTIKAEPNWNQKAIPEITINYYHKKLHLRCLTIFEYAFERVHLKVFNYNPPGAAAGRCSVERVFLKIS